MYAPPLQISIRDITTSLGTAMNSLFAFSTDSFPFAPAMRSVNDVLEFTSQPLDSDATGYDRFIKFLKLVAVPPSKLPAFARRRDCSTQITRDSHSAGMPISVNMFDTAGIKGSGAKFCAEIVHRLDSAILSLNLIFDSGPGHYFCIEQFGSFEITHPGIDGDIVGVRSLLGGITVIGGRRFMAAVQDKQGTGNNFGLSLYKLFKKGDDGARFLEALLNQANTERGPGFNPFLRPNTGTDEPLFRVVPRDDLILPLQDMGALFALTQSRMLEGGAPLAPMFVEMLHAAAEISSGFPLRSTATVLKEKLDASLDEIQMTVPLRAWLRKANIRYIGELVRFTSDELFKMKKLGIRLPEGSRGVEIESILARMGLRLGMKGINWTTPKEN